MGVGQRVGQGTRGQHGVVEGRASGCPPLQEEEEQQATSREAELHEDNLHTTVPLVSWSIGRASVKLLTTRKQCRILWKGRRRTHFFASSNSLGADRAEPAGPTLNERREQQDGHGRG